MKLPKPTDAIHRAYLNRLLSSIVDDPFLVQVLRFKGGTYAAMRGLLDRFSVDLDFDLLEPDQNAEVQTHLEALFEKLGLTIQDKSLKVPQYFLKYPNKTGERNTLQLDVTFPAPASNAYEAVLLKDIDRICYGHTIPTLFANKLVAIIDRYDHYKSIAGRDFYDVHAFFTQGFRYKPEIIEERTGLSTKVFFEKLKAFVNTHLTQTLLDQDLNVLLEPDSFHALRKFLKQEVIQFIDDELRSL